MAPAVVSPAVQAEILWENGNICSKKERIGAAIEAYTEAITLCPKVPVYWTSRALCHRKKDNWARVEEDCRKALELDNSSFEAHFMLGLALLQWNEFDEAVKELEKALELGRSENPQSSMVEEIRQELAKVKYREWEESSTERVWKLQTLKDKCKNALIEKHMQRVSRMGNDETADSYLDQLESLDEVFNKATELDTPTEVPDYLCCRITFEIFCDPVITPSGISYERAVILDHLEKVGSFDPVSREPLSQHQLVPNLAIKEAVQAFLEKNGWAYSHRIN